MAIVRWDPWGDLSGIRERMDRWLEEEFGKSRDRDLSLLSWSPSADIRETDKEVVVTVELPGLDEKDIEIEVENRNLTIRGRRDFEKETKKEDYRRIERSYGAFFRSIPLPASADSDKIKAVHDKGVLRITVPKAPELKPKKIQVQAAGR